MKFILLSKNIIKYLIIVISVIFMGIILYYGDDEIVGDHKYVKIEEAVDKKIEEDMNRLDRIHYIDEGVNATMDNKVPAKSLRIFDKDHDSIERLAEIQISQEELEANEKEEYLEKELHWYAFGHISNVIVKNFLYVALFSIIILTLFSIGIGSSIGALFSFILLYWSQIDYGNIPYLTNGDLAILNDGINDSSVMNLFQTIMVIMTLMMIGDVIEKIINKRRDLIFSRLKMIIPLVLIFLISYGLAINTPSSNPTIVKFVESEGTVLPANATEYNNLTDAEQKSWAVEGKIIRYTDIDINWDHVEIVEEQKISEILRKGILGIKEILVAKQVIYLNEEREGENMVGMGIWCFYILLSITIILIIITELSSTKVGKALSSKLEFIISSISRKFSR